MGDISLLFLNAIVGPPYKDWVFKIEAQVKIKPSWTSIAKLSIWYDGIDGPPSVLDAWKDVKISAY